jgi:hypothetical protein
MLAGRPISQGVCPPLLFGYCLMTDSKGMSELFVISGTGVWGGGGVLGVWWVLFVRVGDSFCSSYSVGGGGAGGGGVSVIAREKAWVY